MTSQTEGCNNKGVLLFGLSDISELLGNNCRFGDFFITHETDWQELYSYKLFYNKEEHKTVIYFTRTQKEL